MLKPCQEYECSYSILILGIATNQMLTVLHHTKYRKHHAQCSSCGNRLNQLQLPTFTTEVQMKVVLYTHIHRTARTLNTSRKCFDNVNRDALLQTILNSAQFLPVSIPSAITTSGRSIFCLRGHELVITSPQFDKIPCRPVPSQGSPLHLARPFQLLSLSTALGVAGCKSCSIC